MTKFHKYDSKLLKRITRPAKGTQYLSEYYPHINMSYDLHFIKKKTTNTEEFWNILEGDEVEPTALFSKEDMEQIATAIASGSSAEILRMENSYEINFPTFQVHIYYNEICISLPYTDENSKKAISVHVSDIIDFLMRIGCSGFDSQTAKFIGVGYDIYYEFRYVKEKTERVEAMQASEERKAKKRAPFYFSVLGTVLMVLVFRPIMNILSPPKDEILLDRDLILKIKASAQEKEISNDSLLDVYKSKVEDSLGDSFGE